MHAVFILFTQMDPSQGGLGFSEADNGRIFALIGILGIVTQGGLIGPLTRKYGSMFILRLGTVLSGIGLTMIPYSSIDFVWAWMFVITGCIAIGNGLFQPSSSTLLTNLARRDDYELGAVMGSLSPGVFIGMEQTGGWSRPDSRQCLLPRTEEAPGQARPVADVEDPLHGAVSRADAACWQAPARGRRCDGHGRSRLAGGGA